MASFRYIRANESIQPGSLKAKPHYSRNQEFTIDNESPITFLNTLYKSCLLGPANEHLETHGLLDGAQRGARAGCSRTIDNLLMDRTVTLDCHRRKSNLSLAWIDVKKMYDLVDHGWLEEMIILHRFPV